MRKKLPKSAWLALALTPMVLGGAWHGGTGDPETPRLRLYVQHGLTVRAAEPDDIIARGDVLTLAYSSSQALWLGVWQDLAGRPRQLFVGDVAPAEDVPLMLAPVQTGSLPALSFRVMFCARPPRRLELAQGSLPPGCTAQAMNLQVR